MESGAVNQDEQPLASSEASYLNKFLANTINKLNEGKVEIKNLQRDPSSPLYSAETFESLRLKPELISACYSKGFQLPSKIQAACIPLILKTPAVDLVAQAQNGTGKTATFLLSLLQKVDPKIKAPQALVIAPTIELAQQIHEVAKELASRMPEVTIKCAIKGETLIPGIIFSDQLIIGTPGTMDKWILRFKAVDISRLFCLVLDEADEMMTTANVRDLVFRTLSFIKGSVPNCQLLFFSATFDDQVQHIVAPFARDPFYVTVRREDLSLRHIEQFLIPCSSREEKFRAIVQIFSAITVTSTIIFVYSRASADWLADMLNQAGRTSVITLHGAMTVEERARNVEMFAKNEAKVLITTNVASRGLDISQVTLVINYDPPLNYEQSMALANQQAEPEAVPDYDTYLHRIGRTGRFGRPGIAVNMSDSDITLTVLKKIEKHFNTKMHLLNPQDRDEFEKLESAYNGSSI